MEKKKGKGKKRQAIVISYDDQHFTLSH